MASKRTSILSHRDMNQIRATVKKDEQHYLSRRDPDAKIANRVLTGAEVALGAGIIGWLAGRTGSAQLGNTGIPLGLLVGAAGHAFALLGPDKYAGHAQNVANGAIAGWLVLWAAGQGVMNRENAGLAPQPITAGKAPQPHTGLYALPGGASPNLPALPPPGMTPGMYNPFATPPAYASSPQPSPRSPLTEAEIQAMVQESLRPAA